MENKEYGITELKSLIHEYVDVRVKEFGVLTPILKKRINKELEDFILWLQKQS